MGILMISGGFGRRKTKPIVGLRPEIRSTKPKIRNIKEQELKDSSESKFERVCLKKQTQFYRDYIECKYLFNKGLRKKTAF